MPGLRTGYFYRSCVLNLDMSYEDMIFSIANIEPKKNDNRFQQFRNLFKELNITRNLGEDLENWNYQKLDETNRVAKIINHKIKQ